MVTFCPILSQVRQAVAHLRCEDISIRVVTSVRILNGYTADLRLLVSLDNLHTFELRKM